MALFFACQALLCHFPPSESTMYTMTTNHTVPDFLSSSLLFSLSPGKSPGTASAQRSFGITQRLKSSG